MIVLCRVDHRLLHGQIAFSWTNSVSADSILIANDEVVNDEMWKTTLRLAKPANTKLVIQNMDKAIHSINSGVTDRYRLLVVVRTIKDAHKLATNCSQVKSINLGGTKKREGDEQISKAIFVDEEDIELLKSLQKKGIEIEIRQLASDSKQKVQLK